MRKKTKKKLFAGIILASLFLFPPAWGRTVQPGETPYGIWGPSWRTELAKYSISDPRKLPVGLKIEEAEPLLGGTLPIAGTTYNLAGSGVTGSATSIILQSLTIPQTGYELVDADFSSTFYVTLEPGNSKRQEIASCTTVTQNANDTATLSGCSRGLLPFSPYTASSTYAFPHGGGTSVIFSDPPQLFNEYPSKTNNEAISGYWTFPTPLSSSSSAPATVGYANGLVAAGVATSSEGNFGGVWLSTPTQAASSTYDVNSPRALYSRYASSSPYSGVGRGIIPVTQENSKLSDSYTDFTTNKTWSGFNSFTGSVSTTGRVSVSSTNSTPNLLVDGIAMTSSTVTSTISGGLAVNRISPNPYATSATTTIVGNLQINGSLDYSGSRYGGTLSAVGTGSQAVNTTGNQLLTHNLGVIPSTVRIGFATTGKTTGGAAPITGTGFYVSGSQGSVGAAGEVSNGTNLSSWSDGSNIISMKDSSGGSVAIGNLSAITTSTFTINWTTNINDGSARVIVWEVSK